MPDKKSWFACAEAAYAEEQSELGPYKLPF